MEPIKTLHIVSRPSDERLWGCRPVLWGLRTLGPDPTAMVQSLSASERREAVDFLGFDLPNDTESKAGGTGLTASIDQRLRAVSADSHAGAILFRNLRGLQRQLDLSEVDLDLIAFRAMLRLHPGFEALAGKYIGLCCDVVFHRKLGRILDRSDAAIAAALTPSGCLVKSGLVTVVEGILGPLAHRLRLLSGMIAPLVAGPRSPAQLLALVLPPRRCARLELTAYPHLTPEIALLARHLRESVDASTSGTNVLLYGRPGTGKTELAAALAGALKCPLYPSQPAPEDGESLTPRVRFQHLNQLQKLVRVAGKGIVLVDEAEDLFPTVWSDSNKTPTKAAVNECLETNPTPTIWVSNRTEHMDEAFLRRFDLVIHVPSLPVSAKRGLLEKVLPCGVLDEHALQQYAAQRELSPAVITRMAKVVTCTADRNPQEIRADLKILSDHYLRTLGVVPADAAIGMSPLEHDPTLLNTDPPLGDLVQAMTAARFGTRMLLHGEPGTGKTAFCKALAEKLDKPLLQRQASALLSCYVGETEKNLREIFDDARREDGVLLLDEADSFLRSRDQARAGWEVTRTNELLTQIEAFEGTLVCTTNRLSDIDLAALRRFDFKVAFLPLRSDQRTLLVRHCCTALGIDIGRSDTEWLTRARGLEGLTPGDAAAVLRRMRFAAHAPDVHALVDALAIECRYKPGQSRPIGFLP